MKKALILFTFFLLAIGVKAEDLSRGYRGFLDWDNNVMSEHSGGSASYKITYWNTGVSTLHGFQFNPHFYLGAGFAIGRRLAFDKYDYEDNSTWGQLMIDARTDQTFGKFTPYADLKFGVWLNYWSGSGPFLTPSVGYRFHIVRKLNLNVGLGATMLWWSEGSWSTPVYDGAGNIVGSKSHSGKTYLKGMFNFRVGIDF